MIRSTEFPVFSVITVCKNAACVINDTLASLDRQSYRGFELIIIDGKSSDETLEIVNRYKNIVAALVSEEDDGIFDAMNKGIAQARGDYVYFLNAGDLFFDDRVLETIAYHARTNPSDVFYGDTLVVTNGSGQAVLKKPVTVDKISLWSRTINHQAIFARRELFERVGKFDTSFKIKADHDWILRCYKCSLDFRYVPVVVAQYDDNGFSVKNWNTYIEADRKRLHRNNYSIAGSLMMKVLRKLRFTPRMGYFRTVLNRLI